MRERSVVSLDRLDLVSSPDGPSPMPFGFVRDYYWHITILELV